jgi:hypothetical protein
MTQQRPLRIGIAFDMRSETEALAANAIEQSVLYLAKLFQHSPLRHSVTLVSTTESELTISLPRDLARFSVRSFEDTKDSLDVLIELGGRINEEQARHLKSRDTRLVSYRRGPDYMQMIDAMISNRRLCEAMFIDQQYDAVWVIPQAMEPSAHILGALRGLPVHEVPFIWDPMCLNMRTRDLRFEGEYRPRGGEIPFGRRLAVMEPNTDMRKFCLYPLLIADQVFRSVGEAIGYLHVTNAQQLANHSPEFVGTVQCLELVRRHKASFVGPYETSWFLSEHTDVAISHEWLQTLDYFHFDACWNGYALVHNAKLGSQIGYYYRGNDIEEGARQLVHAIAHHDDDWVAYRSRQRKTIMRFLATNPELIARYDTLLAGLFDKKEGR